VRKRGAAHRPSVLAVATLHQSGDACALYTGPRGACRLRTVSEEMSTSAAPDKRLQQAGGRSGTSGPLPTLLSLAAPRP
jgi:hypothetical protein